MLTGMCACTQTSFQLNKSPTECCYCCCSICRRLTGSAMGAYGKIAKEDFTWLKGAEYLSSFMQNENPERVFCSRCGSTMSSIHALNKEDVYISLGCLGAPEKLEIEYQQFVQSKAEWFTPSSELESYESWPPWIQEAISNA